MRALSRLVIARTTHICRFHSPNNFSKFLPLDNTFVLNSFYCVCVCSSCFRRPRATELGVQTNCRASARHPTRYLAGLRVLRVLLARPVAGAGRHAAGPCDLDGSDWLELELWVRVSRAAFAVQPCTSPGEFEEKRQHVCLRKSR